MSEIPKITHEQLLTLYQISEKINSHLNLDKLLDELIDLAIDLLHAEKGLIFFLDRGSGELTLQIARHKKKGRLDNVTDMSRTVVSKVEKKGEPILLQSVPDVGDKQATHSQVRYKLMSVICVPLRHKDSRIGVIYLDTTDSKQFFKEEDIAFLQGFANLAAVAIANARSYQEVEDLNTNLEAIVAERTAELQQKNQDIATAYEKLKNAQMNLIRTEKMASLGQLVAGIAHEINTPLGSVNSNTDSIESGLKKLEGELEAPNNKAVRTLGLLENLSKINKTACERMAGIVKSLRNFARLDENEIKTVDLHEGIESTLSLVAHLSRDRIEFVKDYGELPPVKCYANQLNQVFMNLLVNGCQAIEDKGKIYIKTRADDHTIHIEFRDTGKGIAAENIDKIFDPGYTTKGVGVGTGLGLSISYRIVEEHNGEIEVQSEPGEGATFTVHLPLNGLDADAEH